MDWKFYVIYNGNYSYAGVTPDLDRRIKKHNQELHGGAKYTKMVGKGWQYLCQVHGFKEKTDALKFEWAVKHCAPRKETGVLNRVKKVIRTLNKEFWTSKSPSSINYELKLVWCDVTFIPEKVELPDFIEQDILIP
jgi:predicted GIY-YIG superfamily endonuclease